jgi:prephenate dehydrogenase
MSADKEIGIVGFGRFGQLLASILKSDFTVKVYDQNSQLANKANELGVPFVSLDELLQAEIIFYCVPISCLEQVIIEHLPIFKNMSDDKLIVDVLSVKTYPKQILQELLPAHYQILLTHPMFGPDSVKAKGLDDQIMIMDKCRLSNENFSFWKNYFLSKKLKVVEMSADKHDQLAAKSQAITHIIGRVLDEIDFEPTPIDALGARRLHGIKEQTCNDTWQLFVDLQTYNPYAAQMRVNLASAFDSISKQLDQKVPEDVYS